jgi:four helix bundle protein
LTEQQEKFDLENRLIGFAVSILNLCEILPATRVGNHVSGQLMRAGTSAAPNYGEAQSAESRRDFIHKMKVALKELRESRVWLKIIIRKDLIKPGDVTVKVLEECAQLIRIFAKSVLTAESRENHLKIGN